MKNSKSQFTLSLALAVAALTFSLTVRAQAQTVTILANFNGENGISPNARTDGGLYGATLYNSNDCCSGAIFKFSNGLSPLVQAVPTAGKVGQSIIILGNGLSGSTSVTFNGVAATFTVESDTYIKATVPAGATTGTVSVVTPSGTLTSNPQFVVTR
jgi:hypothetical protein